MMGAPLFTYCGCDAPVMDPAHDAGCRRCGLPVDFSPRCQWFSACRNAAAGTVVHPVLGDVPTCGRCADLLNLHLVPAPVAS